MAARPPRCDYDARSRHPGVDRKNSSRGRGHAPRSASTKPDIPQLLWPSILNVPNTVTIGRAVSVLLEEPLRDAVDFVFGFFIKEFGPKLKRRLTAQQEQ
jgi:hypothetical protein